MILVLVLWYCYGVLLVLVLFYIVTCIGNSLYSAGTVYSGTGIGTGLCSAGTVCYWYCYRYWSV